MRARDGQSDLTTRGLLFGFLGGPIAWTLHFAASYLVVAIACATDFGSVRIVLAALTVLFAVFTVWAGVFAYRQMHRAGVPDEWSRVLSEGLGRDAFVMLLGLLGAGLFLLLILFNGIAGSVLPTCAGGAS